MKKEFTQGEIIHLHELLSSQKLAGEYRPAVTLEGLTNKTGLLRLKIALSAVAKPIVEALQEAIEALKDERFSVLQQNDARTAAEEQEFQAQIDRIRDDYAKFERTLLAEKAAAGLPALTETEFKEFMNANTRRFDLNQLEALYTCLVEEENKTEQ